jgi:hypothetical protein
MASATIKVPGSSVNEIPPVKNSLLSRYDINHILVPRIAWFSIKTLKRPNLPYSTYKPSSVPPISVVYNSKRKATCIIQLLINSKLNILLFLIILCVFLTWWFWNNHPPRVKNTRYSFTTLNYFQVYPFLILLNFYLVKSFGPPLLSFHSRTQILHSYITVLIFLSIKIRAFTNRAIFKNTAWITVTAP